MIFAENMEDKITGIISKIVTRENRKNISSTARLKEDLGMDSMALIKLVLALEEAALFDIETADVDLTSVRTVEDVIRLVSVSQSNSQAPS